ncbi:MAG: 4Fe-4S binding protein, partial [Candidatus Marinimicrobia bacterium]|nr:4Fe-4S binding protein [Candidatus Neomarinimicrobiota bacterium]
IPQLTRPALKTGVSYQELKSGFVEINGRKIRTASISSLFMARKIADTLRQWIERGEFTVTQAVEPLSTSGTVRPLMLRQPEKVVASREKDRHRDTILIDHERCIHCDLCIAQCPHEAISKDAENFIRIDPEKCTHCRTCVKICSVGCFE